MDTFPKLLKVFKNTLKHIKIRTFKYNFFEWGCYKKDSSAAIQTIKEKLQYNIKIITRMLPGILKTTIEYVQRTKANLMVTDLVHSVASCRLF